MSPMLKIFAAVHVHCRQAAFHAPVPVPVQLCTERRVHSMQLNNISAVNNARCLLPQLFFHQWFLRLLPERRGVSALTSTITAINLLNSLPRATKRCWALFVAHQLLNAHPKSSSASLEPSTMTRCAFQCRAELCKHTCLGSVPNRHVDRQRNGF